MTTIQILLISLLVLVLIALFIKEVIWPKYFYKGFNITGKWEAYYNDLEEYSAILKFRQKGSQVRGSSQVLEDTSGTRVDRSYSYKGIISNRSLVLTFSNKDNTQIGAMVFWISNTDATIMRGTTIYYKPEEKAVKNHNAVLLKMGASKTTIGTLATTDSRNPTSNKITIDPINNTPKDVYRTLLTKNKEREVIDALKSEYADDSDVLNDLVHIERALNDLNNESIRRTSSREDQKLGKNHLIESLLTLINKLE